MRQRGRRVNGFLIIS